MTILFVLHYSGFYGANKSLLTLVSLLRERYSVTPIVLLPNRGVVCDELENAEIEYHIFHYYWWVNDNHGFFQWLLNKRKQLINGWNVKKICSWAKEKSIDLVYTNSICVNLGYLMAKRLGLPHIWQARESLVQFSLSLSLSLTRSLAIWKSPTNKKYLLISDYMMNYYRKYLPSNRMVRVYNGVSLPCGISRINKNIIEGRLQVCCIGVLSEQKNQIELLNALKILLERGTEIDVWLLGTGESAYIEELQSYIDQSCLNQYVHLVGHTNDVFQVLQVMNLGVVCAHDEAFGRVTVEYMLMQMPVIASQSGANAELIVPGVTGNVYPLGDTAALADAIELYVNKPDLLALQGCAGESVAKQNYSAERNAEQIYSIIQDVLNS